MGMRRQTLGCAFVLLATLIVATGASPTSHSSRPPAERRGLADWVADLSSPQWRARVRAAKELGEAQPKAFFAADALIKAADDPEPAVKAAAMEALGHLYRERDSDRFSPAQLSKRAEVIRLLCRAIDDPQTEVRRRALRAIEEIGTAAQAYS